MSAPTDIDDAIEASLARVRCDVVEVATALEDIRLATVRIEIRLARITTTLELVASVAVAK